MMLMHPLREFQNLKAYDRCFKPYRLAKQTLTAWLRKQIMNLYSSSLISTSWQGNNFEQKLKSLRNDTNLQIA